MCVFSVHGLLCYSDVRISTCSPPVKHVNMSICCYTENVPSSASIFVTMTTSTGSKLTTRIGSDCSLIQTYGVVNHTCDVTGLIHQYSIFYNTTMIETVGNTFKCGFYGNTSSTIKLEAQQCKFS